MPALSLAQAARFLAQGVQLGFLTLWEIGGRADGERRIPCRFCGVDATVIAEKNIIGGFGAGRFYNQSPKLDPSRLRRQQNRGSETMPRQVNTTELDEFCQLLFRTLDRLGDDLLPLFLSKRPTAYEK
jgi:hypothetical protein